MPFNHRKLEKRLSICDTKLSDLFKDEEAAEISTRMKQRIKAVQDYYNLSYTKASTAKTVEKIATSYEFFVEQLSKVKSGELKYEEAIEKIGSASESRKINTLFYNLAKACELMFWAATTFSLYAGIWGIAIPVLVIQPVLGVAVGITMGGAMLAAAYKGLSCLTEFKSFSRHNTEYTNEVGLVSFFKPALPKSQEAFATNKDDELELERECCF